MWSVIWAVVLAVLAVYSLMGALVSFPPAVQGSELDLFIPPPWPAEHTDSEGRALAYKQGGRFQNPWMQDRPSVLSFFSSLLFGTDESNIPGAAQLAETMPVRPPDWLDNTTAFLPADCRLTWLGHATVLAELDGAAILTDPMFSERASPVGFAGPARYTAPACTVEQLPAVAAVVISHSHYDHLDLPTTRQLAAAQPDIQWFVPVGLGGWLREEAGAARVVELAWWEEAPLQGTQISLTLTPANHWGKRGLGDDNRALWGSWAVVGPRHRFWFGGDTGYCEQFKTIGDKLGPFDLAAIPIGEQQSSGTECINQVFKYHNIHKKFNCL